MSQRAVVVDTGPLVALLDEGDGHHAWATEQLPTIAAPLLLCEPVLSEAMFLLSPFSKAQDELLRLVENGALSLAFHVEDHIRAVRTLIRKYADQPMSLADACVVRMAELFERHAVFTLDFDFTVYRKHGRSLIDLLIPPRS